MKPKPIRGTRLNMAHPLSRGMVGCWLFNEGTGGNVFDLSLNGNHGTINGADWVPEGLGFNGTSDYVQTLSNELKTANEFTILVRFKADATNWARFLVWQGEGTGNGMGPQGEMDLGFGMYDGSTHDNYLHFAIAEAVTTSDANTINAYTSFSDTSSWHVVVAVAKNLDSSPYAELYLDGSLVDTDTGTVANTAKTFWDTDLRIGRPGANERYFDGEIGYVCAWRRALHAAEIGWLYREQYAMVLHI